MTVLTKDFRLVRDIGLMDKPCFRLREGNQEWEFPGYSPHAAHEGGTLKVLRNNQTLATAPIVDERRISTLIDFRNSSNNPFMGKRLLGLSAEDKLLQDGDEVLLALPDYGKDPLILDKWVSERFRRHHDVFMATKALIGRNPTRNEIGPTLDEIDRSMLPVPEVQLPP